MNKYLTLETAVDAIIKYNPSYSPTVFKDIFERYGKFEDVEPVRHGHWIKVIDYVYDSDRKPVVPIGMHYECSICGHYEEEKEPYCNCGAKMDGREPTQSNE